MCEKQLIIEGQWTKTQKNGFFMITFALLGLYVFQEQQLEAIC